MYKLQQHMAYDIWHDKTVVHCYCCPLVHRNYITWTTWQKGVNIVFTRKYKSKL